MIICTKSSAFFHKVFPSVVLCAPSTPLELIKGNENEGLTKSSTTILIQKSDIQSNIKRDYNGWRNRRWMCNEILLLVVLRGPFFLPGKETTLRHCKLP